MARSLQSEGAVVWRREPFRIFFPLGIALAWIGIGHWVAYAAGWIGTYSCTAHGLVQIQGFLLAFALGFLLTAIPRRTASEPASAIGIVASALALVVATAAAFLERWWLAEGATLAVLAGLVGFARTRFVAGGGGRRPPAAFVLLPLGLACAMGGGALVAWGSAPGGPIGALVLGRLLVTQGTFFCLVMGAGVYGAEAAARHHFKVPASKLTSRQAALLAVSLPNPFDRNAGKPGRGLRRLAGLIERRARGSGDYIRCIYD